MSCKYNYNGKEFDTKEGLYNEIIEKNFKLYKNITPELEKILDDLAANPTPQRTEFIKKLTEKGIPEGAAKYFYGITQQPAFKSVIITVPKSTESYIQQELFPENSKVITDDAGELDIEVQNHIPYAKIKVSPEKIIYTPLETIIGKLAKHDKNVFVNTIFNNNEEQLYTYRVLAYTFTTVIQHYRKTLGQAKETSDDLKSVIIGTLGKFISKEYGEKSKQFINFLKLKKAILAEDSKVWSGFKQHLNTYHGYKIIDIEEVLDEEDQIKKDWSDKAQFTLNQRDTIANEIKELFNSTYRITSFIPNSVDEDSRITEDSITAFNDTYKNNDTPLGIVDTIQWADYSKEMFTLMEGATNKEQMLNRLYIAANIDTPKHKALLNIWMKLKKDTSLQYLWYRQFKKVHDNSVLSLTRTNNEISNHKMVFSNQDTFVNKTVTNRWLDQLKTNIEIYADLNVLERELHPIATFLAEIEGFAKLAKEQVDLPNSYYSKLAKLLSDIGINITGDELKYVDKSNPTKHNLIRSVFPPMGVLQKYILNYKPDVDVNIYDGMFKIADIIKLFRFDDSNSSSLNANGNIESASVNPNFLSDWFDKLKNPLTQQAALEAMLRMPIMQHSNILWHEPNTGTIEADAILNENSNYDELETADIGYGGAINGILNYSLVNGQKVAKRNPNGTLKINITFLDTFEVVNYKGIKNTITNKVDEYDSYDNTMRSFTDLVEFYNNPKSKYKSIGLYPMRNNSDSGWSYKILSNVIPTEDLTKMIAGYRLTEAEQKTVRTSVIYKKFLNALRQDVSEIQQASILLFGDKNGIVKLVRGKLKINPNLNIDKLHASYHFNGYNADGSPMILDKNGVPTGNVFKARSLKRADGRMITDILPYFKHGAILSNSYLKSYNGIVYDFIDHVIAEIGASVKERIMVVKDQLLNVRDNDNNVLFVDDSYNDKGQLIAIGSLNSKIYKFALNNYIMNIEQGLHWEGTLAEFDLKQGDVVLEYIKRANASTKLVERANPTIIDDNGVIRRGWNTLSITDIELQDVMLEDKIIRTRENLIANNMIDATTEVRIDELLKPKPANLNKAEAAIFNEIKGYKNYTQSDGVSILTFNEFKNHMRAFGMYEKYKELFTRIDNKEELNFNDFNKLIESQKEYYYHRVYDPYTGVLKSKMVKDAKYILIPGYISGQLLRLSQFMDNAGIDEIQFLSATKMKSGQSITIHDETGNLIDLSNHEIQAKIAAKKQEQYYEYLGVQQTIHSMELDSDNKLAVQIIKVIWDNIVNDGTYKIDNNSILGEELFNHFSTLFSSQIIQSMNELMLSFGGKLTVEDGAIKMDSESSINEMKVVEYIRDQVIKQGLDKNITWGLEYTNGLTNVPVAGNMHIDKIKSILESLITNRVIRQVHPGPHSVLVSNAFMSTDRKYKSDNLIQGKEVKFIKRIQDQIDAGKRTSALKAEEWVDGKTTIIKAEVVLSAWSKQFIKEGQIIDINELSEDVRTMIAYYVPYEDKHSTIYLEVVGFVPSQSNQIFIPDAMIPRSGKDFDIDTAYLMAYNTYKDNNGVLKVVKYLDENTSIDDRWKAFTRDYIKDNKALLLPFLDILNDRFEELNDLFDAKVRFTGDPDLLAMAKKRRLLYAQIHNEKAKPEPDKALIKSLYKQANEINATLLDDGNYPEFVKAIKDKKLGIKTTQESIDNIRNIMFNILIDNKLMPSFEQFKQLNIESQNTFAARQNRMLSAIISVISDPKHFSELEKTNDFSDTQQSAEIQRQNIGNTSKVVNVNNYVDAQDLTKVLLQTVNLKGRAVSHKGLVSILAKIMARVESESAIKWRYKPEELALPIEDIVIMYGANNVILEDNGDVTINHTFIGNNLNKDGKNIANTHISSVIAQIVSNILDSVKFPMSPNLNGVTLNAYSIAPTLGVSHKITVNGEEFNNPFIGVDTFIHQPIIRELTDMISIRSSNTYIGSGKNNEVFELRIKWISEVFKNYYMDVTADELYDPITEPAKYKDATRRLANFKENIEKGNSLFFGAENRDFIAELFMYDPTTKGKTKVSYTTTNPLSYSDLKNGFNDTSLNGMLYQISLLNNWVQLDKLRGAFFNAIQVLNQEKRKYSVSSSNSVSARLAKYNNDTTLYVNHDNKMISIYNAIYEKNLYPILGSIYNYAYKLADDLIKPFVLSEQPIIKRYLANIFETYKVFNPEMQDKISKYFTNQVLFRMPILQDIKNKEVELRVLGLGENITSTQLTTKNISIEDYTNLNLHDKIAMYKVMFPDLIAEDGITHILNKINIKSKSTDIIKLGYVKIDYISDANNNEALNSVDKLHRSNEYGKLLVADLIRYSFLIDGLSFGYNLSKTIPYPILNEYGYSQSIRNFQTDLSNMEELIQAVMNQHRNNPNIQKTQLDNLLEYYTTDAVNKLLYDKSGIVNDIDLMRLVHQANFYDQSLTPIMNISKYMQESNEVYWIKNSELYDKRGYYYKFMLNDYTRIKTHTSKNLIMMNNNYSLFETFDKASYGDTFNINLATMDSHESFTFKDTDKTDLRVGNIVAIKSPYSKINKESKYINVEIIATSDIGVITVKKTVRKATLVEPLYARLDLGGIDGISFYYPIGRTLPNTYGETNVPLLKSVTSKDEFIHTIIPAIINSPETAFDKSVKEAYDKHIANETAIYADPLFSDFDTENVSDGTTNIIRREQAMSTAIINEMDTNELLMRSFTSVGKSNIVTILESEMLQFRRILIDELAALNKQSIIVGLTAKLSATKAFLATFNSAELSNRLNNKDVEYWNSLSTDIVARKQFFDDMFAIKTLYEGYNQFSNLISPYTDEVLNSMNESERIAAIKINDLIRSLKDFEGAIANLSSIRSELVKYYLNVELRALSVNPDLSAVPDKTIMDELTNLFDKGYDDMSSINYYLDSMLATSNAPIALIVKKFLLNELIRKTNTVEEITKLENATNTFFKVNSLTRVGQKNFEANTKERAKQFTDTMFDKKHGKLIIEFRHEFVNEFWSEKAKLDQVLIDNKNNGGKASQAYIDAEKAFNTWKRNNLSQQHVAEYLDANERIDSILNQNIAAKEELQLIYDERSLIMQGEIDRSNLTNYQIQQLKDIQDRLFKLGDERDERGELKTGKELAIAKTLTEWRNAKSEFYEKFHMPIDNPEFDAALALAKSIGTAELANFLEKNTKLTFSQEFYNAVRDLSAILYGDATDEKVKDINAKRDAIINAHKSTENYSDADIRQIQQLEQERQDYIIQDRDERIIKFTKMRNPLVYTEKFLNLLRNTFKNPTGPTADEITRLTKLVNDLLIPIKNDSKEFTNEELTNRYNEVYELMRNIKSETELYVSIDDIRDDVVEDIDKDNPREYFESHFDFAQFAKDKARIEATGDRALIDAWTRLFESEFFDDEYRDRLRVAFARTERKNQGLIGNKADRTEADKLLISLRDLNNVINGRLIDQTTDRGKQQAQEIKDRDAKFTSRVRLQAYSASKHLYTAEFWDKLTAPSKKMAENPIYADYLKEKKRILDDMYNTYFVYSDERGIYDSTKISLIDLQELNRLTNELKELTRTFNDSVDDEFKIIKSDEQSEFITNETTSDPNYAAFDKAYAKVVREHGEDSEYTKAWLNVNTEIDLEAYRKTIEDFEFNLTKQHLQAIADKKTDGVKTEVTDAQVRKFIANNTITLSEEGKKVYASKAKNGELKISELTADEFNAINRYINADNETIESSGLLYYDEKSDSYKLKYDDMKSAVGKEVSDFKNKRTKYGFTEDYLNSVRNAAEQDTSKTFSTLYSIIEDHLDSTVNIKAENRNITLQLELASFASRLYERWQNGLVDDDLAQWFFKNHRIEQTGRVMPKGYYLKITPNEGASFSPNPRIWSEFMPINKAKYTDMGAEDFRELAEFVPTQYYKDELQHQINKVGADDIEHAKGSSSFMEWYNRNHYYDAYTREFVPIRIWTRLMPKDKRYIHTRPNKQFYGYSTFKQKSLKANSQYIDQVKTDAKAKLKELGSVIPTQRYHITKQSMIDKYGINSKEYQKWYNENHYIDRINGDVKPIKIWTKLTPNDQKHFIYNKPESFWNKSEVKPEYINPNYRENRKGYAMPQDHWKDSRWEAIKDDPMYQYLVDTIPTIIGAHPDWVKETGFIPIVGHFDRDNIDSMKDFFGWTNDQGAIERSGVNNQIVHILQTPYMRQLFMKNGKNPYDLPKQSKTESSIAYEQRVLKSFERNGLKKEDGTLYTSLNDIIKYNNNARAEATKFTVENMQLDPYMFMKSFIGEGLKYKYRKAYEHELLLNKDVIKDMNFNQRDTLGNKLTGKAASIINNKSMIATMAKPGSNLYNRFDAFLNNIFYEVSNKKTTLDQAARMIAVATSFNFMGFNIPAGIDNLLTSSAMIFQEGNARLFTTVKDLNRAGRQYVNSLSDFIGNAKVDTNSTLIGAIMRRLDIMDVYTDTGSVISSASRNTLDKLLGTSTNVMFFFMNSTEHVVQNTMAISMHHSHRLVNGKIMNFNDYYGDNRLKVIGANLTKEQKEDFEQYKKERLSKYTPHSDDYIDYFGQWLNDNVYRGTNIVDALRKYKDQAKTSKADAQKQFETYPTVHDSMKLVDGRAKFKDETPELAQEYNNFKLRIQSVNQSMFGIYDKIGANILQSSGIGALAMQFRKWMKANWNRSLGNRFGKSQFNEFKQVVDSPMYASWFKFVSDPIKRNNPFGKNDTNILSAIFNILHDYTHLIANFQLHYATLSEIDKANIRRVNTQIGVILISIMSITLLAKGRRDDDDDDYLTELAIYQAYRLYGAQLELTPFGWLGASKKMLSSPFASIKATSDMVDFAYQLLAYPFLDEENRIKQSGMFRGESKLKVAALKASPFRAPFNMTNIPALVNYYKMYTPFDLNTKQSDK